jgi:diguanylate cyclase (GGDEF)-like protein
MNRDTVPSDSLIEEPWRRARLAHGLRGFAPLMPLGTLFACMTIAISLWPVTPRVLMTSWLNFAVLLTVALWAAGYVVHRFQDRPPTRPACRRWLVGASLAAGLFWGATGVVLLPDSAPHQAALALIIAAATALWLPLFVIERITVLTTAVPSLLPMALKLLLPPTATPMATMGSLSLVLLAALVAAAALIRRMFDADEAVHRALYHRATHDPLVELVNCAEFDRHVAQLEATSRGPYAVVFIDLDHFKRVNDTAGHLEGDRLLREVGAVLREEKRKADVAARVGGDEFAILMDLCSDDEAVRVASAVAARIERLAERHGPDSHVTASIGIACSVGGAGSVASVVDAADRACYAAKRSGRNRIELARRVGVAGTPSPAAPENRPTRTSTWSACCKPSTSSTT